MYGFSIALEGVAPAVAERVGAALGREGFGVLWTIDVAAELRAQLGVDRRPYLILGACHPQLASRALEQEPNVGLLLPCNVVVREVTDGRTVVSFPDPERVWALVERPELTPVARDAKAGLERVRDALANGR